MEVKTLYIVALSSLVIYLSTVFNYFVLSSPNPEQSAGDVFLLHQTLRMADKYLGEDLSYAYYLELNDAFNPSRYSDQSSERWDVPDWFTTPEGGTTVSCRSFGCMVWNLEGGTSDEHDPCPDVVKYSPNPSVDALISSIDSSDLKSALESNVIPSSNLFLTATLYYMGRDANIMYRNLDLTKNGSEYTASADLYVKLSRKRFSFSYSRPVEKIVSTKHTMSVDKRTRDVQAYCVCDMADDSLKNVAFAVYKVRKVYVDLKVLNENIPDSWTGRTEVNGSLLVLQYFTQRTDYLPGFSVKNCRIYVQE